MICLRCGYCCRYLCVILPDGSEHRGEGKDCKFLTWEGNRASCTVHGKDSVIEVDGQRYVTPWEETPCGRHGQIGKAGDPCRMGVYQRGKHERPRDDQGA